MTLLPLTTRLLAGSLATVTPREVAGLLRVTLAEAEELCARVRPVGQGVYVWSEVLACARANEPKPAHRLDVAAVRARAPRGRAS
jgi:hypothetical protein